MPEGPTILMMAEEARKFVGKTVRDASGNGKLDYARMQGRRVKAIRSFGKLFLVEFAGFALRAHLLLFGSYRIDARRDRPPRLHLAFANGELHIYGGALKYLDGPLAEAFDWRVDVLSDAWDPAKARKALRARPDTLACDALLDQDTFAGVGNIIKNEVLHRIGVHPAARLGELPPAKRAALVKDARAYSFQFLAWKRVGALRRNLRVHRRGNCADCGSPLRLAVLGETKRRAFWCDACQPLPAGADAARATGTPFKTDGWWARRNEADRAARAAAGKTPQEAAKAAAKAAKTARKTVKAPKKAAKTSKKAAKKAPKRVPMARKAGKPTSTAGKTPSRAE